MKIIIASRECQARYLSSHESDIQLLQVHCTQANRTFKSTNMRINTFQFCENFRQLFSFSPAPSDTINVILALYQYSMPPKHYFLKWKLFHKILNSSSSLTHGNHKRIGPDIFQILARNRSDCGSLNPEIKLWVHLELQRRT